MGAVCSGNNNLDDFLDCCRTGELSNIRHLIDMNSVADINEGDETGLAIASRENHYQIVLLLLRQESLDVNKGISSTVQSISDSGVEQVLIRHVSPLFLACEKNHIRIAELLTSDDRIEINNGVSIKDLNARVLGNHRTPLTVAAEKRHYDLVRLLLKRPGIDPSRNDVYKVLQSASTLYYLCRDETEESLDALNALLSFKKFYPRKDSLNPFFPAIENGNREIVKKLLDFEHICNFINHGLKGGFWGRSPLYLALEKGEMEIVTELIHFEKTSMNGHKNFRPIHICCEKGYNKQARRILKTGRVNYNQQSNKNLETPLHIAVRKNNFSLVRYLLRLKKIDKSLKKRDKDGNTPEDLATSESIKKLFDKYYKKEEQDDEDEGEGELDSDSDDE